jgi:hypothetical protein
MSWCGHAPTRRARGVRGRGHRRRHLPCRRVHPGRLRQPPSSSPARGEVCDDGNREAARRAGQRSTCLPPTTPAATASSIRWSAKSAMATGRPAPSAATTAQRRAVATARSTRHSTSNAMLATTTSPSPTRCAARDARCRAVATASSTGSAARCVTTATSPRSTAADLTACPTNAAATASSTSCSARRATTATCAAATGARRPA